MRIRKVPSHLKAPDARDRPLTLELIDKVEALIAQLADLQGQVFELRRAVAEPRLRRLMDDVVTMRSKEISTLTGHAVKALRLLIDAKVITQEQANEAIK
jgi:hypothetical protein